MAIWSEQEEAILRVSIKDGLSRTEISKALCVAGFDRSSKSVTSKIKLLRDRGEKIDSGRLPNGYGKSMAPEVQERRAAANGSVIYANLRLDPMPDEGKTFEELRKGQCHWPLGGFSDPVKFFCGAKAHGKYCARHSAIARGLKVAA